jgi:hypothetical protein
MPVLLPNIKPDLRLPFRTAPLSPYAIIFPASGKIPLLEIHPTTQATVLVLEHAHKYTASILRVVGGKTDRVHCCSESCQGIACACTATGSGIQGSGIWIERATGMEIDPWKNRTGVRGLEIKHSGRDDKFAADGCPTPDPVLERNVLTQML